MINRAAILHIINTEHLESIIERVWTVASISVPKLTENSLKGSDCRLGLAEYMINKYFANKSAHELPGGAFHALCERLQADDGDIGVALERTQEDLGSTKVPESEIAITMVWLWLIDAAKQHGDDSIELKFLLYSLAAMLRHDQTLQKQGMDNLVRTAKKQPILFLRMLTKLRAIKTER